MRSPTLFDSDYEVAIYDMVDRFKHQLKDASSALERAEIELAIRSWMAAVEPPARQAPPPRKRTKRRTP